MVETVRVSAGLQRSTGTIFYNWLFETFISCSQLYAEFSWTDGTSKFASNVWANAVELYRSLKTTNKKASLMLQLLLFISM